MNSQEQNDSCICLTPDEFKGSEILQAKYEALVSDTTNMAELIRKLGEDKLDLGMDKVNLREILTKVTKQYNECMSVPRESGFNLLEVTGISAGVALVTAIITILIK